MNKKNNLFELRNYFAKIKYYILNQFVIFLTPVVTKIVHEQIFVWGNKKRLQIAPTAKMVNTLFNTMSGNIQIGNYTFTGHNVSIITGKHDYNLFMKDRMYMFPEEGRNIVIGDGVWIGSNSTILGPCTIGDNAVIGAGSLVIGDIPANTIYAGVPAKEIKRIG